ncbi:unnamed protein product [Medioppia subpectinata]|uniref:Tyrosine-protein phosphatase domain-containing protein n=1 Tax=Medioppia subpectinata TaxID=1979941 RepID=A0A7R9QAF2_9ACAR|nr:unnamed protein product [Medioppia subpectinata]CAG2117338.1 unnamed protein product [Medioppia subpectinata]
MVSKCVYLSGIAALTKENLELLGITLIINATYEWPDVHTKMCINIRVPVANSEGDDISVYFDDVSYIINENMRNGGNTVVHSVFGKSRSTTLVLAYLVKYERIALKNAFISVKNIRETARPNVGFWDQLIKYEIKIRGVASVKMLTKKVDGFDIRYPDLYPDTYEALSAEREAQIRDNIKPKSN